MSFPTRAAKLPQYKALPCISDMCAWLSNCQHPPAEQIRIHMDHMDTCEVKTSWVRWPLKTKSSSSLTERHTKKLQRHELANARLPRDPAARDYPGAISA